MQTKAKKKKIIFEQDTDAHQHTVASGMDGAQRVSETLRGFNNVRDGIVERGV